MKCGICGQRYEPPSVKVLGHRDDLWFLSVYCHSCKTQGLVAAFLKEGKLPSITAELTEEEYTKFSGYPPIESDDILDMHTFLEEFSGDFSSLFSKR